VGALYLYVSHKLNSGNSSVINSGITAAVPPELTADQMNILVLGLDYTESDSEEVSRSKDNPQADMILYIQYDKKAKTIKMLQIPRDVYVGPEYDADGTGKINGVYAHGPNKENKVQNIVAVLNDMLQLQVDHWITIDMESLREMVDVFGGGSGIPINLPYDIVEYTADGQVAYQLLAGEHNLKGDDLEFFLRARKADGMYRGDIDRLDNQKLFYSALFNYMRTMTWQEMVKLMPFFLNYVETDISPLQCAALGVSVMSVPNENITLGRLPVILSSEAYYTAYSQVVPVAIPQTVECLNTYFRPAESPVTASQLNIPVLYGLTEPVVDCDMKHIGDNGTVADGAGSIDGTEEADVSSDTASAA
jgi:LCP family protein required for cell wall assembly